MKISTYLYAKVELKKLFAERGLHMGEVAEQVKITRQTIYKIMKGKGCSPAIAKKICDSFDVEMWDYFELRD